MKNSNKILFTLSVFQMFSTSALTASSRNMFDNVIDREMVQIQQEYKAESRKEQITNQLINTIVDPKVQDLYTIVPDNPLSRFRMIRKLLSVHFSNHIQKRAIDNESVELFNAARKNIKSLANEQILSSNEEKIAYAVMPDAAAQQLLDGAKVVLELLDSPHEAGALYWASGKHTNATFKHVLTTSELIHQMGPTHSINAVCLILSECIRRKESLTYEELDFAHKKIIDITNSSRDYINIAQFIYDNFPKFNELVRQIIREAINKIKLNYEQLEWALSMILDIAPLDQSTIYRLTKMQMRRR